MSPTLLWLSGWCMQVVDERQQLNMLVIFLGCVVAEFLAVYHMRIVLKICTACMLAC